MTATVVYIRWKDAAHGLDEVRIDEAGELCELHEVGFLVREGDESVTISLEHQEGATETRNWLTIPLVNVVEILRAPVADCLRWMRRRAK